VTAPVLTAEELSARWRIPVGHVYRLSREGKIPTIKLGRYYRYRLDAIEEFECDGATVFAAQQLAEATDSTAPRP
jgi:excisionase family DNA binding protein